MTIEVEDPKSFVTGILLRLIFSAVNVFIPPNYVDTSTLSLEIIKG